MTSCKLTTVFKHIVILLQSDFEMKAAKLKPTGARLSVGQRHGRRHAARVLLGQLDISLERLEGEATIFFRKEKKKQGKGKRSGTLNGD